MVTILTGDCRDVLKTLPDASVNCCVTSPPYFGLRDYGCAGQIGLEQTPDAYVAELVAVFREVKRVLRDDGTLWLNLGDSYNGYMANQRGTGLETERQSARKYIDPGTGLRFGGLKNKDLIGIPWRVAFALQADGWYLRQDIIWHKPNPMPESVTDRCTKAHEYIFLLSKSARYYFDAEAIKEPAISGDPRKPYCPGQVDARGCGHERGGGKIRESVKRGGFGGKTKDMAGREAFRAVEDWRNKRSVWTVTTKPYRESHFATFPPDLIRPCILAGCPIGGTVIDTFGGSGTTGEVAEMEMRNSILIELNPKYVGLAEKRTAQGGLSANIKLTENAGATP